MQDFETLPRSGQELIERFMDDGRITRADGTKSGPVDLRFIATTTLSISEVHAWGALSERLRKQFAGLSIEVPALRVRRGEIRHIAERLLLEAPRPGMTFNEDALGKLIMNPWPGNIAEMRDVILRAAALAPGLKVRQEDIAFGAEAAWSSRPESDDEKERQRFLQVLELCGGNQRKAAEMLGISRRTMVNRMSKLSLPRPRK
jgi:two-component system, NtrC family, response regulator AtoC